MQERRTGADGNLRETSIRARESTGVYGRRLGWGAVAAEARALGLNSSPIIYPRARTPEAIETASAIPIPAGRKSTWRRIVNA